jgi:nitrite reductase/ring-hydroxylating ferredoxin subunit
LAGTAGGGEEQAATAEWVPLPELDLVDLQAPRAVEVGGVELVVLRQGERYVALDRWCPHAEGDLAKGRVLGKALKCPLHGFMFNLDHGRGINCPGFAVAVHEVRVDDGVLSVRLRREPPDLSWSAPRRPEGPAIWPFPRPALQGGSRNSPGQQLRGLASAAVGVHLAL